MNLKDKLRSKDQLEKDVVIKIERSISTSSSINTHKTKKQIKYCSLVLKLAGLLIIVGVVLLFALLPNYIRNQNANNDNNSGTDPTNARLPGAAY